MKINEAELIIFQNRIKKNVFDLVEKLWKDLNIYHGLQKDRNWWEVVLSPWLNILIYRYELRKIILSQNNEKLKNKLQNNIMENLAQYIPNDFEDFNFIMYHEESRWNSILDTYILKFEVNKWLHHGIKIKQENSFQKKRSFNLKNLFFIVIIRIVNQINKRGIFTHVTYINWRYQIKLMISKKLISYEHISPYFNLNKDSSIDLQFRNSSVYYARNASEGDFLYETAKRFIPRSYLEDLNQYFDYFTKYWPKSPRKIITANSHLASDLFKYYLAENKTNAEVVILQHGAYYGTSEMTLDEDYEISISNSFYTWGWSANNLKVKPLGVIKNMGVKANGKKKSSDILIIEHAYLHNNNFICGLEGLDNRFGYKNLAQNFIKNIDTRIMSRLRIRSLNYIKNEENLGRSFLAESAFKDVIKTDKFSNCKRSLVTEANSAKITICMTDSTPFLELLNIGLPVIGLWPKQFESIRSISVPDFDKLRKLGIIFNDEKELANFINNNITNIEKWWSDVQNDTRYKSFVNKYCRSVDSKFMIDSLFS